MGPAVLTTRVALLLEQCLAPVPGGTGRYSRELARALAATAPPSSSVTGWTAWHRRTAEAVVPGVAGPHRLPLPRRALAEAWARGLGPRPQADVVHAPTLLVPPRGRAALVVTIHDTVPWTEPETLTRRGAGWHRRMAERAAREADLVVVPTAAVARELGEFLQPRRVEVVGEGVAAGLRLPEDRAERVARLGLSERTYLATLATFEPRKGLDVAVRALARPELDGLDLVAVGEPGWGGVDPRRLAEAAGLAAPRLRLTGRITDPDLAAVLAGALALLVPSRAEGFGLPALEAMALGTPVVVTDVPALVEVTGGAALVVPRDDAAALAAQVTRLRQEPGLPAALAEKGRRRAGEFTWTGAAQRLWQLYADLRER
jgi:glycosyltransferase involved in cell wall biosynthesis